LYRTGPGSSTIEAENGKEFAISHWFDGFTQVHRFQILPSTEPSQPTRVLYNSRRTVDHLVEQIRKSGKLEGFSFGQKRDPCESFFKKLQQYFFSPVPDDTSTPPPPDARNIGVTLSANPPGLTPPADSEKAEQSGIRSLVNKTDASAYQFIDPETLEPIGIAHQTSLHPGLKGPFSAAHAKTCPVTGEVYNYNLEVSKNPVYKLFCASPSTGKTRILATITDAPAAYLHSLLLTQNYVILCVWGSHYAYKGMSLMWNQNILDSIASTDKKQPAKWYVIDRTSAQKGIVATYQSDTFFCFHTINAYEETTNGQTSVIADLTCFNDTSVLKRFYYENLLSTAPGARTYTGAKRENNRPWLARYRLPSIPSEADIPGKKPRTAVQVYAADRDHSLELPTINPAYVTKKYRYTYGVTDRNQASFWDGLAKFDSETQTSIFWQHKAQTAGEPIFVRDPEGTEEDDGVLLTVVLDGNRGRSYLLCLNARDLTEMGRAETPVVVGFGFHGIHVPSRGESKGRYLDV
jgi:torulene dioxygenase